MGKRQQPVLKAGRKRLAAMSHEELIATVEHMANLLADIDATCNRAALPGEWTIIGDCGCCGSHQYSHHKLTPHKTGCPIDNGIRYCRNGFKA